MTNRFTAQRLRRQLLLSACFVVAPGVAQAQTTGCNAGGTSCTINGTGNVPGAETREIRLDAEDNFTVDANGVVQVSSASQAINLNATSTNNGVTITNNGLIDGVGNSSSNGRGIATNSSFANRAVTIINRGTIRGANDGIQLTDAVGAGLITIDNAGSIINTGVGQASGAQGVQVTVPNATLVLTNRAGATISGSQGLQVNAAAMVTNSGTITGTGAISTQGEGVRSDGNLNLTNEVGGNITGVYGVLVAGQTSTIVNRGTISGSNATGTSQSREGIRLNTGNTGLANQTNTITLVAGSVTSAGTGNGATGNAIAVRGTPLANTVNTLNIETGALINGNILGAGNANATDILNLTGSGSQILATVTDFDTLNVQGGTWGITNEQELRNGATIAAGATLRYDGDATTGGLVTGDIVNNGTLIDNLAASATSSTAQQDGMISGTGGVQVINATTLVFNAANSYSGATVISNGRLRTGQLANSFSANSAVTVSGLGILDLNDTTDDGMGNGIPVARDQTIANLAGDGTVRTGQLNAATLTVGGDNADATFAGTLTQLGGLTKQGAGTLTLAGANTATGLLAVNMGAVSLTGSYAGAAQVANGATLTGGGTLAGALTVADGGTLAPGAAGIGTLSTGALTLSSGSILNFDFGAPGSASDRIAVNGDLALDGTLNINDVGGFGQGVYRLIDYSGALTDGGLAIGGVPAGANPALMSIQTAVSSQINLIYGAVTPTSLQFWDGADLVDDGVVDGGNGSWTNNLPNWTGANGTGNTAWTSTFAVFQGAAGVVSVDAPIAFTGMQFVTDGYTIAGGTGALSTSEALANLRVDPGVTATIAASIGGSGGLLKNDAGTLILAGTNSYAGATNIAGGTLRVLGGAAIPVASAVTLGSGATLDIAADQQIGSLAGDGLVQLSGGSLITGGANANTDFAGTIAGNGGLTKTGTGTQTLSGANSYAGATQVAQGTLALSGGGTLGGGDLAITAGATVDLGGNTSSIGALSGGGLLALGQTGALTTTAAADSTFGGTISGGTFTKAGLGTLTLAGATSVSRIIVSGGGLTASTAGAIGANTGVSLTGGTLTLGADQTIAALDGTGPVALGANRLTIAGGVDSSYAGAIAGTSGLTKAGAGTFTLTGASSYTGATQVAAGTLAVGGSIAGDVNVANGATLAGSGSATGQVTIADGGTIAPGMGGIGTLSVGGLALSNGSILAYQLGAPGQASASDRVQVAGNLTLDGVLNVTDAGGFGPGVYRLIDYGGALTDKGLAIGALPPAAANGDFLVQTSVANQVNLVYAASLPDIQFWDGPNTTANGAIDGGSGSWTNARTAWADAAGTTNQRWGGRFAVFQGAAGTVTVDDTIAFTGMQFMTSGYTIAAGSGALTTSVAATVRVDPGATATIAAPIGGGGGIVKLDTGTLILGGVNSYTGGTQANGGTLRAAVAGALPNGGDVAVAAGATLDLAAAQTIGALTGAGAITLSGGGLTAGAGNATSGFDGVISGAGGLTKAGTGTLTLTGANSFTGATTVAGGTLAAGAANSFGKSALVVQKPGGVDLRGFAQTVSSLAGDGNVTLGAGTLTLGGADSTSYAGVISGTGGLTRGGSGTLTLTGANSFTGRTNITGGALIVNGSLASPVTVAAGGKLGGSGQVGALTVSGTLAPGNSIGTMRVNGALTFAAGSTYQVEVNPNGTSDLVAATGAVSIQGGTVSVLTQGLTNFATLTNYTIVTGSAVTGAFAGVTSDLAFLTPSLSYTANSVLLRLERNNIDFASVGQTANQRAVGAAVSAIGPGALYDAVLTLDAPTARRGFDLLSGEIYAAASVLAGRDAHRTTRQILDRLDTATGDGVQLWAEGGLIDNRISGKNGLAGYDADQQSLAGGVDYGNGATRGGIAFRYGDIDIAMPGRASGGHLKTNSVLGYVGHTIGRLRVKAGAGAAWTDLSVDRTVAFGGFANQLSGQENGTSFLYAGEASYLFGAPEAQWGPFVGISGADIKLKGTSERGGPAAALAVGEVKHDTNLASYGVRGAGRIKGVLVDAEIGGRSYLGDEKFDRDLAFAAGGPSFTVASVDPGKTTLTTRLDLTVPLGRAQIGFGVRAEKGDEYRSYEGRVRASLRF